MNSQGQRVKSEKATRFQSAWMLRALANAAAKLGLALDSPQAKQAVASRTKHSAARSTPNSRSRAKRLARRTMATRSRHVNEGRKFARKHMGHK